MIPSKAALKGTRDITNPPSGGGSVQPGTDGTDGNAVAGVGSTYSAVLVERENKSLARGEPSGPGSANTSTLPTVGKGARRTGRV